MSRITTGKLGKMQSRVMAALGDGGTVADLVDRMDWHGYKANNEKQMVLITLRRLEARGLVKGVLRPVTHKRGGYPHVIFWTPCEANLRPSVMLGGKVGGKVAGRPYRPSDDCVDILSYLSDLGESDTRQVAHGVYCDGNDELIGDEELATDAMIWSYRRLATMERYGLVECMYRKRGYPARWVITEAGRESLERRRESKNAA